MGSLNFDEYRCVTNGANTFYTIAEILREKGSYFFAWTDERSTQYDVLMVFEPEQFGPIQRGLGKESNLTMNTMLHQEIYPMSDEFLFVGIIGRGCLSGFRVHSEAMDVEYISEKLDIPPMEITSEKLLELINGVMGVLADTSETHKEVAKAIIKAITEKEALDLEGLTAEQFHTFATTFLKKYSELIEVFAVGFGKGNADDLSLIVIIKAILFDEWVRANKK